MKSVQRYVNQLMDIGATGKSYAKCEEFVKKLPKSEPLSEQKMQKLFQKYHPAEPNPISITPIPEKSIINLAQIEKIKPEDGLRPV